MSKKTLFIYSTLSSNMVYANHIPGGADLPVVDGDGILISGGANIPDKRLVTPLGVVTKVTAEELAYLKKNAVFLAHEKNGFILVSETEADPEVVAADMATRDASAPVVEQDYREGEAPVTGAADRPAPSAGNSRRA